jgi:hypothetical protein
MHSFLVAAIFVAMVLGPCVVALFTGIDHADENPQPHSTETR